MRLLSLRRLRVGLVAVVLWLLVAMHHIRWWGVELLLLPVLLLLAHLVDSSLVLVLLIFKVILGWLVLRRWLLLLGRGWRVGEVRIWRVHVGLLVVGVLGPGVSSEWAAVRVWRRLAVLRVT